MKKAIFAVAVALFGQAAFAQSATVGVAGTPHDLVTNASNIAKYGAPSAAYTGITPCNFCHAVHNANNASFTGAPLWNRPNFTVTFTMYDPALLTGNAVDSAPNPASLTCLSCHEGSAVLGELFSTNSTNVLAGGTVTNGRMDPVAGRNFVIGTTLRNDHPVSFPYVETQTGGGEFPAVTGSNSPTANVLGLPLYGSNDRMECATCHNPHDNRNGRFLRLTPAALCATCHTQK